MVRYCFDKFDLNTDTFELLKHGEKLPVEPQALRLLQFLLQQRDRAVSKDEIMENVWSGRVISDATLANCVKQIRQCLGDSGTQQTYLRTVRGRGYRFVHDVNEIADDPTLSTTPSVPLQQRALPELPSIALLGFDPIGRHADTAVFAEGLASDLNARLARLHGLFVTARHSARRFSPQIFSLKDIAAQLGVRYLVYGSVQRSKQKLRVNALLVEAADEGVIWSEHFDRAVDDLFDVQDDIVNAIISTLIPEIERAEMERARLVATENLNAWECYHKAMWYNFRFTARDTNRARSYLQQAIQQDPEFSRAYAGLSFTHFNQAFLDDAEDPEAHIRECLQLAERSVQLNVRDALSHWMLGRALFLTKQHERALHSLDQALLANPNYAQGHYAKGFVGVHAGIPEQALSELDKARRLSPFDPLLFAMKSCRAISLAVQGECETAAQWAVAATLEPNAHFHIHAIAGACLQMAGQTEAAQESVLRAQQMHPGYTLATYERSFPHSQESHRTLFRTALLDAGLSALDG